MSGFEVAGIVLGALPLLISAIENYESNLDRARSFWKWEGELEKFIRELWIQHSDYELTLRNLLKDVASQTEVDEMMTSFQHDLWASQALSDALQHCLQGAYGVYVHTIKEMESYMIVLAKNLDIDRRAEIIPGIQGTSNELEAIILANQAVQVATNGRSQFRFQRRVKLTLKRKEIRRLLGNVQNCNRRLDQFIEKAAKLEQPRTQGTSWKSSLSMPLQQIQEYTTSLHQAFGRAWSCSTQAPHQVYLLLEHRMVHKKQRRCLRPSDDVATTKTFTMSLKSPVEGGKKHGIEVQILEDEPPTTRRVQFEGCSSQATSSCSSQTTASKMKLISNLCPLFCHPLGPVSSLGFNVDRKGRLYGTYQVAPQPICLSEDLVSLDHLLSRSTSTHHRRSLATHDRYLLAITLASSFLQLHRTPWLRGFWTKRDILFSETTGRSNSIVDIQRPFILNTYSLENPALPDQVSSEHCHASPEAIQDHIDLLNLAKILLEIKLNDESETRWNAQGDRMDVDVEETSAVPDVHALLQWMMAEKGNLSVTYRNAVSHCIKCSVDPNTDLRDLKFRQTLVDDVVVPLLEDLRYWQGDGVD